MSFSEKIKIVRKRELLTQDMFAKEINVSFSTVNRWENGKGKPNLTTMKAIKTFCETRGIPYEDLEEEWIKCTSK